MKLLSLDLELNQPSGSIIQIGACVGDTETGKILESFCEEIKIEEQLSEFIINLTGITQAMMEEGEPLSSSYERLVDMSRRHECFINTLTWGGGDSEYLQKQINPALNWSFGRRWIDAKTVFISYQMANGQPFFGGLKKSIHRLGMKFEGEAHNALADARNTFFIYHELLGRIKAGV